MNRWRSTISGPLTTTRMRTFNLNIGDLATRKAREKGLYWKSNKLLVEGKRMQLNGSFYLSPGKKANERRSHLIVNFTHLNSPLFGRLLSNLKKRVN